MLTWSTHHIILTQTEIYNIKIEIYNKIYNIINIYNSKAVFTQGQHVPHARQHVVQTINMLPSTYCSFVQHVACI